MDSFIISSRDDETVRGLQEALRHNRIEIKTPKSSSPQGEYQPILEDTFLLVDMRDKPDYQQLSSLHGEYPGAQLICFFDTDDVHTRTAVTFGGADLVIDISEGTDSIVKAAIEKTETGKTNFREPIGMTFTAGNVFFNTGTGTYRELPVGFKTVAEALPHMVKSHPIYDRGYGNGVLSPQQCIFLEQLKITRDKLTDPSDIHEPVAFGAFSDSIYKPHRRPKKSSASKIARNLARKFENKAPARTAADIQEPSIDPRKHVILLTDDVERVALCPPYEYMS